MSERVLRETDFVFSDVFVDFHAFHRGYIIIEMALKLELWWCMLVRSF